MWLKKRVLQLTKNHWLLLAILIGVQYLTGEQMVEPKNYLLLSPATALLIHNFNSKLILIVVGVMGVAGVYLKILRRTKG